MSQMHETINVSSHSKAVLFLPQFPFFPTLLLPPTQRRKERKDHRGEGGGKRGHGFRARSTALWQRLPLHGRGSGLTSSPAQQQQPNMASHYAAISSQRRQSIVEGAGQLLNLRKSGKDANTTQKVAWPDGIWQRNLLPNSHPGDLNAITGLHIAEAMN